MLQALRAQSPDAIADMISSKHGKTEHTKCNCGGRQRLLPTASEIQAIARTLDRLESRDDRIRHENNGKAFSRDAAAASGAGGMPFAGPELTQGTASRLRRNLLRDCRILTQSSWEVPIQRDHGSISRNTIAVKSGAFDLEFEPFWHESEDDEDVYDTLEYVWDPYYSSSALKSYSEIHAMIKNWTPSTTHSDYKFWQDGWGGSHRLFLHAVRLLDVYRGYIINGGVNCPNAGVLFQSRYTGSGYKLKVDNHSKCSDTPDSITYDNVNNNFPTGIDHSGNRGVENSITHVVRACANLVEGQGHVADYQMYWAHKARMYAFELMPDLITAIYYMWQSQRLGRLALGAASFVSRTLLHEMMHREFSVTHCSKGCCMQRISLRWQCRVFSALGLYVADSDNGIDTDLLGLGINYYSVCKRSAGDSGEFHGRCDMNNPGVQSAYDDWIGRSDWTNPDGCP